MNTRKENLSVAARIVRPIAFGGGAGILVCLVLLLAAATVMASCQVPQAAVTPVAVAILAVAAFLGGFTAARIARERGLLYGAGCGLLLFLVTAIAGLGTEQVVQGTLLFLKLAVASGCGAVGGIVGVNMKRR
ncbi:MAG: TIGR04086 family membrane protein [Clostridia bacterium]|nr:TIGR04086 family membrane protein [Clostridia bacterium]